MSQGTQVDWFAQNAPKAAPAANDDWFATNAPSQASQPPGIAKYADNPTFQRMKQHGFDDLHAASAAAYEQLPFLQQMKIQLVPGARDKWLADTFNNGNYIPSANPYERVLRPTVGEMTGGAMDIAHGDIAGGAHRVITGAGTAALPLLPGAAGKAPGAVLKAMAGGYVGGKLGEAAANAFGATPEQAALTGDVGNIVGGGLAASTNPTGVAKKVASAGSNVNPDLIGAFSPRLAHILRVVSKVAEVIPDNASEATHPKTTKVMQDLAQEIGPLPTGGAEKALGPMPGPAAPQDMSAFYGRSSGKSNLKGNQRQLFGPTTSTAPNPTVPQSQSIFTPKSEPTAEDLKFQDANLANILQASLSQLKRAAGR